MTRKTILITGATRGLGFAAVQALARQGHQVILSGRSLQKAEAAARKIQGAVFPMELDVTSEDQVVQAAQKIRIKFEKIDVLINNAGAIFDEPSNDPRLPLASSLKALRQSLDLHLIGPYSLCKYLIPLMHSLRRSDIINVSSQMASLSSTKALPHLAAPAYRISKSAINSLTVHLDRALRATEIYVNSVCPGWCRTDLGGPGAFKSPEEGVEDILWIVNEEPSLRGQFINNRGTLPW